MAGLSFRLRAIASAALLVFIAACGDSTAPTAPTQASVTLNATPNPVTAVTCHPTCKGASGASYPFQLSLTVVIQESARIAGNVDFINVAPVTDDGTALPVLGYGPDVITLRSGSNHVDPGGILSFPLAFLYSTGTPGAHLKLTVTSQYTDDKGNRLANTLTVDVVDPQPVPTDAGGEPPTDTGGAAAAARVRAFAESK